MTENPTVAAVGLVEQYIALRDQRLAIESEMRKLNKQFVTVFEMAGHEKSVLPGDADRDVTVTRSHVKQFNVKLFEATLPDMYADFLEDRERVTVTVTKKPVTAAENV